MGSTLTIRIMKGGLRMERYLTANDAASEIGVTETTVRNLTERGALAVAAETLSGIRLYLLEDVRQLANERAATGKRSRRSAVTLSPVDVVSA